MILKGRRRIGEISFLAKKNQLNVKYNLLSAKGDFLMIKDEWFQAVVNGDEKKIDFFLKIFNSIIGKTNKNTCYDK